MNDPDDTKNFKSIYQTIQRKLKVICWQNGLPWGNVTSHKLPISRLRNNDNDIDINKGNYDQFIQHSII